jgi:hypothetical protein
LRPVSAVCCSQRHSGTETKHGVPLLLATAADDEMQVVPAAAGRLAVSRADRLARLVNTRHPWLARIVTNCN